MKAFYINKSHKLEYGEVPLPKPKTGEALIKVKACALNHLDLRLAKGILDIPLPHVPGSDVAGIIEEMKLPRPHGRGIFSPRFVGSEIPPKRKILRVHPRAYARGFPRRGINGKSKLKVGQEVVVNPSIPCGKCSRCKKGLSCEIVTIFGYKTPGGYAEYVTVPIEQLYPKPKNLSFVEAAAFPLTFLTAYHMLVRRAKLQKGETVFIWGASGGLGSAAVQIAKYLGARIIAAGSTEEDMKLPRPHGRGIFSPRFVGSEIPPKRKILRVHPRAYARGFPRRGIKRIKAMGANYTVDYKTQNVEKSVNKLTNNEKVDVVFESVGVKTWNTSLAILRPHGRVVIAGTTSGSVASQDLSDVYYYQHAILGSRMGTQKEFEQVLKLIETAKLKPIIDKVFPLKEADKALKRLAESRQIGKIVLEVS